MRAIGLWFTSVVIIITLLVGRGSLNLSPSAEIAKSELYSIVGWELENFPNKWINKLKAIVSGNNLDDNLHHSAIIEYISLTNKLSYLKTELANYGHSNNTVNSYARAQTKIIQDIESIRLSIASIQNDVEEFLESRISTEIQEHDIGYVGPMGLHLPPVDFRLTYSPKVLIISPRNRIEMTESILIKNDIQELAIISIENSIADTHNLSTYIANTGGLATYPSTINHNSSVSSLIDTAAHEWLHHYLFFKPLGQSYWSSNTMRSINETTANIFGKEISDTIHADLRNDGLYDTQQKYEPRKVDEINSVFDFRKEMQVTRLEAENMLSNDNIQAAEEYMENRRQYFVSNGYHIRVLNQAYFAFHGTYADSPSSISPIYSQLITIRNASRSLNEFINRVSSISNHEHFLDLVTEAESEINNLTP